MQISRTVGFALLFCVSVAASTSAVAQQMTDYHISVYTKPGSGNGTDNTVTMWMFGSSGRWSSPFEVQGSAESGDIDEWTRRDRDIGVIKKISLRIHKDNLLDTEWTPMSITIYRGTRTSEKRTEPDRGWSEFIIDRELGFGEHDFNATSIGYPVVPITVSPVGAAAEHRERFEVVHFQSNPTPTDSEANRFQQTWSHLERVSISESSENSVGAEAKVSVGIAGLGAEVGASWSRTLATLRNNETETAKQSTFDFTFSVPANSSVFHLVQFESAYLDQTYTDSKGNSRVIRKRIGDPQPTGISERLVVPRFEEGAVVPILLSDLETKWLARMADKGDFVRGHLDKWIENGWVVTQPVPARPVAIRPAVVERAVVAEPPPAPATQVRNATPDFSGAYRVRVKASGRYWSHGEDGDKRVAARDPGADDGVRFRFELQADGSYRIAASADSRYLTAPGRADWLLSTRWDMDETEDGREPEAYFLLERQTDGAFRIRQKSTGVFVREEERDGERLISTGDDPGSGIALFYLEPWG